MKNGIIFHKLDNRNGPLLCDTCGVQIVDVEQGIVLFMDRQTKKHPPTEGIVIHKNCCDTGSIRKSMELSEFLALSKLTWPLPEEGDGTELFS